MRHFVWLGGARGFLRRTLRHQCRLHPAFSDRGRTWPAGGVVKWWCVEQKEPAPLFFTHEELQQAADVFAIEILDMKQGRRVLYGEDLVAAIEVPMNLHRVQIEHDLRTVLLKLRQHYLRAPGNVSELGPVLRKSFSGVLTLLRHTVIAFGEQSPTHAHEIIAR